MRIVFTTHAVEQYQSRVAPGRSYPECLADLKAATNDLRRGRDTHNGEAVYLTAEGVSLVVKLDRGRLVCVTVIGPGGTGQPAVADLPALPSVPTPTLDPFDVRRRLAKYLEHAARKGDRAAARLALDAREVGIFD